MPNSFAASFSRRGPDVVIQELALVLSGKATFEFKPLFDVVYSNLKARHVANGSEEMLRLRVYEKLQNLVNRGMVEKANKKYRGIASALARLQGPAAGSPE